MLEGTIKIINSLGRDTSDLGPRVGGSSAGGSGLGGAEGQNPPH